MANELQATAAAGATVTAKLVNAAGTVAATVTLTEGPATLYRGSVPAGTAAGTYAVIIGDGYSTALGTLVWDGTAEVLPPAASAVATAVRSELAVELARIDADISSVSGGGGGGGSDPLLSIVPGAYSAGTAGAALGKLNALPANAPAVVVPGVPASAGMCRLYGYFEGVDGKPSAGLVIDFELVGSAPVASERLIGEFKATLKTDALGRLVGRDGSPWADMQRNDLLLPAGSTYQVSCPGLRVSRKTIELTEETADLKALLMAA